MCQWAQSSGHCREDFQPADKLWLRDHEATTEKLLSADTQITGWGDTFTHSRGQQVPKQVFAPSNATRMEVILGAVAELYLNGLYRTRVHRRSPVALNSGCERVRTILYQ